MSSYIKVLAHKIKKNVIFYMLLRWPLGKKVYFIGTPEYSNLGDSAIALAQILFLEKCGYKRNHIKAFTQSEYTNNASYFKRYIKKRFLICGIGGGNMGNLWCKEELFRYSFVDEFPDNPIIIFPQTVFFTDNEEGEKAKRESRLHYEKHHQLTLVAREKLSFDILNSLYHIPQKLLVPDIVLSTKMDDYGVVHGQRSGALLVFRNDSERNMSDFDRNQIVNFFNSEGIMYKQSDMYSDVPVTPENRVSLVKNKMQEFADSQIVITDRLHGLIFAALTGTPAIVFCNNHHKIKGTYEWISDLPYIEYVDDVDEAIEKIPRLLNMSQYIFDDFSLSEQFVELKNHILEY